MSVVLTILKIIGIVLLVILCIILAILLIVLFVPIRYSAEAVKEERGPDAKATEGLRAKAGVSWLAHIISFRLSFEDGKLTKALKIFGIDLSKRKKKKEKKKKKKVPKAAPERPLAEIAVSSRKSKKGEELPPENPPEETREEASGEAAAEETEKDPAVTAELPADKTPDEAAGSEETERPESAEAQGSTGKKQKKKRKKKPKQHRKKADSFSEFLWRIGEAVWKVVRKIAVKVKAAAEKLAGIFAKIEKWTDFLEDERTQNAIALALREVGKILKGLAPKKVDGYVRFGHDDPYKTGQQLAYLAAAYPLYGKNLEIEPDFEKKTLEGNIELKGRLFLAAIVWAALKLILNKNIKYVIGFVRNKEEKANGGE